MKALEDELKRIKRRNAILKDIAAFSESRDFIKVEVDDFELYDRFMQNNPQFDMRTFVKVQDLNGNMLLLKPDITTNIISQVAKLIKDDNKVALYYLDNVYSYDENNDIDVSRQYGIELLGNGQKRAETMIITMIQALFTKFNLPVTIELGDQAFLNTLINYLNLDAKRLKQIKTIIMHKNLPELKEALDTITNNPYKTLLIKLFEMPVIDETLLTYITDYDLDPKLYESLKVLLAIQSSVEDTVVIDLTLIHQYNYYNGPIFKGYTPNVKKDILRGGRYDTLTKTYGRTIKALGFSLDMDTFIEEVTHNE